MNFKDFLNFRKWFFCGLLDPAKGSWLYKRADCKRYEESEIEVEICTETHPRKKATEWCKLAGTAKMEKFKKGEVPTEFCEFHKDPDPIVKVWACLATKKKPLKSCRMTGYVDFKTSEVPTEFCKIHKLPPKRTIPYFHHDGLGLFLDFLDHAWNPEDQAHTEQRIMNYLGFIGGEGVDVAAIFSYLMTNTKAHQHLNGKIPYLIVQTLGGKKADLKKENPRYYELFDRFCYLASLAKIKLQVIAEMNRYTFWVYENNINGVPNFWHEKAAEYQNRHVQRMIAIMLKYWTIDEIEIVPINEPNHRGSDEKGHIIAEYCKRIWLVCQSLGMKLRQFFADISASEFARAQLVFHGWTNSCLKCGNVWRRKVVDLENAICPKCGQIGYDPVDKKYWIERGYDCPKCRRLWDNIESYKRDCIGINHGISILADLEEGHISFKAFLRSGNTGIKWTEDASSNEACEGYVMGHGYPWRLGSAVQLKKMLIYVWTGCKENSREKIFIFGIYPMEQFIIHDWGIQSYYSITTVNHDRFVAVREAYEAVHGGGS